MFKPILLSILICFSTTLFSQNIILHFTDSLKPIPYVYVRDTAKQIHLNSDSFGTAILKSGKYTLQFNHVSYQPFSLKVLSANKDTIINIVLQRKPTTLEDVVVVSNNKKRKREINEFGNYYQKHDGSGMLLPLNQDIKMAFLIRNYKAEQPSYLNSILFKLKESNKLRKEDFIIEIKLFAIENNKIDQEPLNTVPIYIASKDLKNSNEIILQERIALPKEKFLISFELPIVHSTQKDFRIYLSGWRGVEDKEDDCLLFIDKNTKSSWEGIDFFKKYWNLTNPLEDGKTLKFNIGITY